MAQMIVKNSDGKIIIKSIKDSIKYIKMLEDCI